MYYKACTKYFTVSLCTTKLAQNISQYYFVLRSLRKALPSTTLYYKPCTKYVPVLLSDTKLAQRKLLHTASSFAEKLLHTASFLNREAFYTQKLLHTASFYTEKLLHTASFRAQQALTHTVVLHMASVYTHSKLFKQRSFTHREAFTHSRLLHTKSFTHSKRLHTEHLHTVLLHTETALLHREAFTHSKLLRTKSFTHSKLWHTASVYTQNTYTQCFYTWQTFTQRRSFTHREAFTHRNCSSKTGSWRQSEKKTVLKPFWKGLLKWKLLAPKLRKSADKSLSQPWCSHSNTIYEIQLQKTIVLRMQPGHQATLTQPLQYVSQHHIANLHVSAHIPTPDDNNHAAIPMRSATTDSKTPYNYAPTSTPKAAWSHRYNAAEKRQTDRSRNRRTQEVPVIVGCSHFTRKNTRFRAPASSPTQAPCNIHATITMRFAASRRKPARIYARGNARWQQSCSHSNAICNHRFQNTL